eukprot:TRINITY_DN3725_c0_g1_i1.p1 TRINITY_DN3725_c0_g1~~TRINITY_DN3725_c0_g1_i1.p1  ORF type:complete len:702 (+),score=264.25 TRINITY_DN3725_c0_g1_i1:35-2107(+)
MSESSGAPYEPKCVVSLGALTRMKRPDYTQHAGKGVHWVTDADAEIPLKMGEHGVSAEPPITVMQSFEQTLEKCPDRPALLSKVNGAWRALTYREYYESSRTFAKACIASGLARSAGVAILGSNSPFWALANMGAIFAGGIPAGIYTTNGPEACHYIVHHCEAAVAVVENDAQAQKILQVRDRLPALRTVVVWDWTAGKKETPFVVSWESFMQRALSVTDEQLEARISAQRPGHCCTLIYTSGTTGPPKGVMLSHDNLTWTPKCAQAFTDTLDPEHIVSYLPLSHVAAQMTDLHSPLAVGGCVWFAEPDALKGSLGDTLREVRPTKFMAVPRVWEKIEEKLREVGAANTGLKKMLGDWAKELGLRANLAKLEGETAYPWGWSLASMAVYSQVRKAIGLDRCTQMATGAAPIAKQTLHYFMSLDIPIYELYGMSECSGPQTMSNEAHWRIGSCGVALPGTDMMLDSSRAPDTGSGEGEICFRGRHIFMGYMKNDEATAAAVDENGFLHSGDVGRIDDDGFLFITGRIKELLITAGGENVPPVFIEDNLKELLPVISNAVVIGDKKKYLSCLFTLRAELDADGLSTEQLTSAAVREAEGCGSSAKTVSEAMQCAKFRAMLQAGVDRYNAERSISRAQYIRKWCVLPRDLSVAGGELTPTTKVRRKKVNEIHAARIASLYPDEQQQQGVQARL